MSAATQLVSFQLMTALLLSPAGAFAPPQARAAIARPNAAARSAAVVATFAFSGSGGDLLHNSLYDALMHKSVELQVNAYSIVRDRADAQYLAEQWTSFLDRRVGHGCAALFPPTEAL